MANFVPTRLRSTRQDHSTGRTATKATLPGRKALYKLYEQLRCAICLERYTDPRMLPCHHIFCKKCIDQCGSEYNYFVRFCPTCRNQFKVGIHGASSLPVAFTVSALLEIEDDLLKTEYHEFQDCQVVNKYGQGHHRPKDMYCEKYVCCKCALETHHTHQCDKADFLFAKHRKQVEESLEPMKKKIEELEHTLIHFDTREKELRAQEKSLQKEVNKAYRELVNRLEESQRRLTQELSTAMQTKLERHAVERANAETALVRMQSCHDFVCKELKTRSDYQMQEAKLEYIERINRTHSVIKVKKLQPTQPDTVFTADKSTVSACEHIGKISDTCTPYSKHEHRRR